MPCGVCGRQGEAGRPWEGEAVRTSGWWLTKSEAPQPVIRNTSNTATQ